MGQIVVGVDGSADSKAALRWAVEQARLTGDGCKVVYVYGLSDEQNPFLAAYSSFSSGGGSTAQHAQQWREERDQAVQRQAEGVLSTVLGEVVGGSTDVTVDRVAVPGGRPARVLVKEADDAVLLAVGARGKGGMRGMRLGSIAEKCVRHAPCSVMVVRAGR